MEEKNPTTNGPLSVPVAIVIAGVFIAIAVYFSQNGSSSSQNQVAEDIQPAQTATNEITIRSVGTSDHSLGNPEAPVALIVYTDTECPYCKTFHNTVMQVSDVYGKDGKVHITYRHFPLIQIHPLAQKESEAAECAAQVAGKTAFWDFINDLFEVTPSNNGLDPAELPKIASRIGITGTKLTTFNECLANDTFRDKVATDYEEAVNAGGRGTPFSVFALREPLNKLNVTAIENLNNSFIQQGAQSGPFEISKDKKRVSMSGALPLSYLQQVIDLLVAN